MTSMTPPTSDASPQPEDRPDPADSPTVMWTRRAASGDQRAFQELHDRHYQRVLRATAARLGSLLQNCRHEVEDAVHEAFADTFRRIQERSIPDILSDGSFRRYIATAAANQVRQIRRGQRAEKRGAGREKRRADFDLQEGESVFAPMPAADPSPSAIGRAHELAQDIEQAVLDLAEPYRTAIQLSSYCGMSYDEIAAGGELRSSRNQQPLCTREAVKLVVFRARQMLGGRLPQ